MGRYSQDWGPITARTFNSTYDLVAGFKGTLGEKWSYSGYVEHGRGTYKVLTQNNPYFAHMYRAADAVVHPVTGQIVCRTSIANPGEGCIPINLFGDGAASRAAIDYVTDTSYSRLINTQDVAAFDVRGEPFSLWAGPVAIAFGAEYRKVQADQVVDPISASRKSADGVRGFPVAAVNTLGGFQQSNPQPITGEFSVKEGFVEVSVPLARDLVFAKALDFNGAVRRAEYSTAGGATTWKLGFTYEPFQDVRLRVTQSRDIRAPNIAELFTASTQNNNSPARDPLFNNLTFAVVQQTTGNPDLAPEEADTFTAGVVYQPSWLPGFSASVDYYKIDIAGVISALTVQQVVDGCFAGNDAFCGFIERGAGNVITSVRTPTFNLDARRASGVDIELSYTTPLDRLLPGAGGTLGTRLLATYMGELVTVNSGREIDRAGELLLSGVPHWQGLLSFSYDNGPVSLYLQSRYIGGGKYEATFTPAQLQSNEVRDAIYLDLTGKYRFERFGRDFELFATVNNLLDQSPPLTPNGSVTTPRGANGNRYDFVGRFYTAGLRFRF
jgi:iron complex outermembrane recepter protein